MLKRPVYAELSLRSEIEHVLQREAPDFERGYPVATAWTVKALAAEVDKPRQAVLAVLRDLKEEGRVTRRRLRDGTWLWKLTDDLHDKWEAVRGPAARD